MVDGVLSGENDLRDGNKGVALLKQGLDDGGQGLRGVQGGVVKQNDGPWLDFGGYPLGDLPGSQVFPVQAVTECNKGKRLLTCFQSPFTQKGRNAPSFPINVRKRPTLGRFLLLYRGE